MDHTKTKQFIGFIHKSKKDSHWVSGNDIYDEDCPRIYPYETKDEKELANLIGFRCTQWDDVISNSGEIVGVVLKITGEQVPIISKEKAIEIEMKIFGNTLYDNKKTPKKKKEDESKEVVKEASTEQPQSSEPPVKKKRGRPAKVIPKAEETIPELPSIFGEG